MMLFEPKKRIIDLNDWNRKEHFHFFREFEEPYFGLTFDVDVTVARSFCKRNGIPLFLYYHFLSTRVINEIEAFRLRIEEGAVVLYDVIHATTTIMRDDKTFSFSFIPYQADLQKFVTAGLQEIKRVKETVGLGMAKNNRRTDIIHYSTIPWIPFTGLTHARSFRVEESSQKISFGKLTHHNQQWTIPVSVFAHHALADGYHMGLYYEALQSYLQNPE